MMTNFFLIYLFCFGFFQTGFLCVALSVLELALYVDRVDHVDQVSIEHPEICLLLPPKCWD